MKLRHSIQYRPTPRGITARRLAAARRALQRERDRYALFAAEILAEQESPEDRISRFDAEQADHVQGHRDLAAEHWRWGRNRLASLAASTRQEIVDRWNAGSIPPTACYFADFVRCELKRRGLLE